MVRLLLGLLKGAVVGAALGFAAEQIGLADGWGYVVYGAIGFVVGLVVGRPIWSHLLDRSSTVWTSVLKGLFGFGVGAGLYALGHKVVGDPTLAFAGQARPLTAWTYVFGGIVGAIYGAWVEIDDAPPAPEADAKKPKSK
jgi:hypothetical protein